MQTKSPTKLALPFIAAVALLANPRAQAQSGSENPAFFGNLGQGNAAINGTQKLRNNACVPTATANGLTFLDNYVQSLAQPSPFTVSPNSYAQVNNMITAMGTTEGGTSTSGQVNGLKTYLGPAGANPAPSVNVSLQYSPATPAAWVAAGFSPGVNVVNTTPTPGSLASPLNANDAVEVGIQWGKFNNNVFQASGGAHELTLESISYNAALNSGTIGLLDPWGTGVGANAGSQATLDMATFTVVNGFIDVTFPLAVADGDTSGDLLGAPNGQEGRILDATVERIPDRLYTALFLAPAIALMIVRSRKLVTAV